MEKNKYRQASGRRKTAHALVHYYPKEKSEFLINNKDYKQYFRKEVLQKIINQPFEHFPLKGKIVAFIHGGGEVAQAQSLNLTLAKLISKLEPEVRKKLKKAGLLSCDSRMRERKKPGLKRARRAPQWSKR